jgi:Tfp pilus assembly protein PilF
LKKWQTWTGIAALSLALLTGAYFLAENQGFFLSESQKLSRATVQKLENVLFLPNTGNDLADLQSGMAAYDAGNYTAAARSLEAYVSRRGDNAARVYLGVSRLLSGQAEAAVAPLADAAQSPEPPVREAALWYLALAYLENDNPRAARQALEMMPDGGIYHERAKALLEKID